MRKGIDHAAQFQLLEQGFESQAIGNFCNIWVQTGAVVAGPGNAPQVDIRCILRLSGNALLHTPQGLVDLQRLGHRLKRRQK